MRPPKYPLPAKPSEWFRGPHRGALCGGEATVKLFKAADLVELLLLAKKGRFPSPCAVKDVEDGAVRLWFWDYEDLAVEAERRENAHLAFMNNTLRKVEEEESHQEKEAAALYKLYAR